MRRRISSPRAIVRRFFEDPASARLAAWLIITSTFLIVIAGGIVVRVLDHKEYPTIGRALWFTLQTVTTVGYGDVTPTSAVGRTVAAIVMLTGIGFITITTAAITSTFVEAARRRAAARNGEQHDLAAINARLDRIEEKLDALGQQR